MSKHTKPAEPTAAASPAEETQDSAMASLQADLDRFKDLALRSAADMDNLRKRTTREKEETIRYANTSLLEKLVPIIDNFELGLAAARQEGEQSPVFQGMQMVARQIQDFLTDQGVTPVDAAGQTFDPNLHEAMSQMPSNNVPEGVVIQQVRKGYKLRDRLLRPAAVIVSKGRAQA
jgi:molecular chaperone GrpE